MDELLSESDHEKSLKDKMKEWMDNGCLLGWLINLRKNRRLFIVKNGKMEVRLFPPIHSGEDVMPGFSIDLSKIFVEE